MTILQQRLIAYAKEHGFNAIPAIAHGVEGIEIEFNDDGPNFAYNFKTLRELLGY